MRLQWRGEVGTACARSAEGRLSRSIHVVVHGSLKGRRGDASRWIVIAMSSWLLFRRREVVRVVLSGVVRIRICPEASIDNGGWRVHIHLTRFRATWSHCAFARLDAHISDGPVEGGSHKFSIVFVHDFAVDQSRIFRLLAEGSLEHRKLHGQEDTERDCGDYCDGWSGIQRRRWKQCKVE